MSARTNALVVTGQPPLFLPRDRGRGYLGAANILTRFCYRRGRRPTADEGEPIRELMWC
jgi:hypothetical protein